MCVCVCYCRCGLNVDGLLGERFEAESTQHKFNDSSCRLFCVCVFYSLRPSVCVCIYGSFLILNMFQLSGCIFHSGSKVIQEPIGRREAHSEDTEEYRE